MDPNNPLRGPRRALRRGERALRYDRISDVDGNEPAGRGLERRLAQGAMAADLHDDAVPYQNDRLVRQRMREEAWANNGDDSDDPLDGDDESSSQLSLRYMETAADAAQNASGMDPDEDEMGESGYADDMEEDAEDEGQHLEEEEGDEGDDDGYRVRFQGMVSGMDADEGDTEVDEDGAGRDDGDGDGLEEEDDADEGDFEFLSQQEGEEDEELGGDEEDGSILFNPVLLGLKEINNLAHFSVSSHKPGSGVEELLSDDLDKYWQSDGPQPHLLTIHFLRRVEIRAIRFYVDYRQDESYTPTCVVLSAGTGHHDLLEFAALTLTRPVGWKHFDLSHAGGGPDGQSLCCWIVQIKVRENLQNGKDTHIRGIKLYAIDDNALPTDRAIEELTRARTHALQHAAAAPPDKDDYLFERLITQPHGKLPGAPERSSSTTSFLRDAEIR